MLMMLPALKRDFLFFMRHELSEKCGIVGITGGADLDAARIVYFGLWALQHRGQESSGIAVTDGDQLRAHKGMGLVAHVYDEGTIDALSGDLGIGHNRYSTSAGSTSEHIQPVVHERLGSVHNGNLPSTRELEIFLSAHNVSCQGLNDSEMMTAAIGHYVDRGATLPEAVRDAYPLFTGAFSLLVLGTDNIIAVRDPHGIRPLSIGKLNGGYVFASETCALDTVHASYIGDVAPGQMMIADRGGNLTFEQIVQGQQHLDIFEFVYFARPDSVLLGQSVYEVRKKLGRNLYQENPMCADVVIAIPDSAIPAALGYAQISGIPYEEGFAKNRYIHRTFIQPEQHLRERGVALKLNPLPSVLKGKRVIVIDDSIVRGTTMGPLVQSLRKAGAKEVHVKISSPPVLYPDFYGIDTPDQKKLIAARMDLSHIREHIGADSLQYLSYEGMIDATGLPEDTFSTSCFTGIYPIDIGERKSEVTRVLYEREKTV